MVFASAQELNCNVQVNSAQVQVSNNAVFTTLQNAITEFMNGRRWTDMVYTNQERIDCTINILIRTYDESNNKITAEMTVQSRRPVYGSSYNSPVLNLRDTKVEIEYKEFDQLEFVENSYTSDLTSILAYYAYLIIGYDQDSFSRLGGTPYFSAAEQIVLTAQNPERKEDGWQADLRDSRNRYAIINNLMDEAFRKYRNYFYEYHRLGLDEMTVNSTNARARISEGLPVLREANRARPSAALIVMFLDAKADELINIFSEATTAEKQKAIEILSDVSPTRTALWEGINGQ